MKLELSFISSVGITARAEKNLKSTVKPQLWNTTHGKPGVDIFFLGGDHHVHKQYKISVVAYMVVSKKNVNTRFSMSCVPQPRFD